MSRSAKAAKSALLIMIIIFFSKALGFFREVLIASRFGAGAVTDSYFIIYTIITIVIATLNSIFSTTLVPVFIQMEEKGGASQKNKFTNNLLNITIIITLIITAGIWLLAPNIVKIIASGFEGESYALTVHMLRIVAPMIIFVAIASIFTAYLQSREHFAVPAATGFPLNMVYIAYLLVLASAFGMKGFMVAIIIAQLSTVLFQLPSAIKLGYSYSPVLDLKNEGLRELLLLATPVVVGTILQQINQAIDKSIASNLASGSISSLSYATKLEELIIGVFIFSVLTVIFPILTQESQKENLEDFKRIMGNVITLVFIITIPVTIAGIIMAEPAIEIIFQRGAFDQAATEKAAGAFVFYLLGLTGIGLRDTLSKVFYSLKDTKTPLMAGAVSVALNIILNFVLVRHLDYQGLALATSIAVMTSALLLIISIRKKIGKFGGVRLARNFLKIIAASIMMGLLLYLLREKLLYHQEGFIKRAAALGFMIITGGGVYFGMCYLLKINEVKYLWGKLNSRFKWLLQ